ncbi:MAG: ketosteroid isomerase [Flavobacterium sp.]
MATEFQKVIEKAYGAFNDRDIQAALETMQPNVQWSKAWEGGYISGHNEIEAYWTRQWKEINPKVYPTAFNERPNGSLEVVVHQIVKDLEDKLMFDGTVKHIYTFKDNLIHTMDIELVEGQ